MRLPQKISLVIPVRDEAETVRALLESIARQTLRPDEVVIVDGGSSDGTPDVIEGLDTKGLSVRVVRTDGATPGKGRNIGIEAAANEWIALTDAGIRLEDDWLERLAAASDGADYVQGNFAPATPTFFTRCAAMAYVPAAAPGTLRGRFIASSLLKKEAWAAVGGFPDMRAAEDLFFIEDLRRAGYRFASAPDALVHWQLRPDLASTFRKFVLYSYHNALAGRQWDWHYGIIRQYVLLLPVLVAAALHSRWWLLLVPAWLLARSAKRVLPHRMEFGLAKVLEPRTFMFSAFLILMIDAATMIGWAKAAVASGEKVMGRAAG